MSKQSLVCESPRMITHVLIESLHHAGKNGDMRAITHGAMDQQVNGRTDGRTDGLTDKASYKCVSATKNGIKESVLG